MTMTTPEHAAERCQVEASFIHYTLCEIRDGHTWGDLVMELGGLITDDMEDVGNSKKYSFWDGEARELSATDGFGWPGVLMLVGRAMAILESTGSPTGSPEATE